MHLGEIDIHRREGFQLGHIGKVQNGRFLHRQGGCRRGHFVDVEDQRRAGGSRHWPQHRSVDVHDQDQVGEMDRRRVGGQPADGLAPVGQAEGFRQTGVPDVEFFQEGTAGVV